MKININFFLALLVLSGPLLAQDRNSENATTRERELQRLLDKMNNNNNDYREPNRNASHNSSNKSSNNKSLK